jgi:hypothetical protein
MFSESGGTLIGGGFYNIDNQLEHTAQTRMIRNSKLTGEEHLGSAIQPTEYEQ